MHPQIHSDHPGECPICHMKLVKVSEQSQEENAKTDQGESRSTVQATSQQLGLIGVQKQNVEKMTLTATIPVSGRLLSSSSVAFQVYEEDLRYIHSGLSFRGEDNIYSEEEISGVITSVDSIVDPTSRTVRVVGVIKKGSRRLLPETSFRGEIKIELKDKIAIPESSVLHTGQGELVYIVDEKNKLTPKKIQVGLKAEGFYEVLSGLNPGDLISSGPNFLLDSEAKIRGTE
jgi:multidrug efflux pump subunit AcrA (membrane-fusion protein)